MTSYFSKLWLERIRDEQKGNIREHKEKREE